MRPEYKPAFIMARAAKLQGELAGMVAANEWAAYHGLNPEYNETDFKVKLAEYDDLNFNALVDFFKD